MADLKNPVDVWELIFTQTPTALRWALGVLSLGIFTLAGVLYRWHREDMERVNQRIDRLEVTMDKRHQETNRLLFQIARNTERGH